MKRIEVDYDRERILADAEKGAILTHGALVEGLRRQKEPEADIAKRGKERIERAIRYAEWRMDAYEAGECDTPW